MTRGGERFWVPAPLRPGWYRVIFELRALNGTQVSARRSPRFRVDD